MMAGGEFTVLRTMNCAQNCLRKEARMGKTAWWDAEMGDHGRQQKSRSYFHNVSAHIDTSHYRAVFPIYLTLYHQTLT